MKHPTQKCILPLLLAALCLLLTGCWSDEPLDEGDVLDGLIGAEGITDQTEPPGEVAITSFALPILSGETLDHHLRRRNSAALAAAAVRGAV